MELKKKVLGKGLSSLIPDTYIKSVEAQREQTKSAITQSESGIQEILISSIKPNRVQPRHHFADDKIDELAASIKEQGILQPIIVKKSGDGYELVCGERRTRAAQKCGLDKIPAIVKDLAEEKLLEWALVENIQREDLNPIEEAQAYIRLLEERGLSQDDLAKKVGKDRSTVANTIRLMRLPQDILDGLIDGRLQAGHARALLALLTPEHQRQLAKRIMEDKLSVRQVEELVGRSITRKRRAKTARLMDQDIIHLETKIERRLGTQARIYSNKKNQGRIEIRFYSLDDLDRLLNIIGIPRT